MEIEGEGSRSVERVVVGPVGRRGGESIRGLTTSRMSGRELRDFAAQQHRIGLDELDAFTSALAKHRATRARLEVELEEAWSQLMELILPSLDGAALAEMAFRLGLSDMDPAGVARRSQVRIGELTAARAELDRDADVARSAEVVQTLQRRRKNLDELLSQLDETLDPLEAEPHFGPLLEARYGCFDYKHHFWQRRYHQHRRQAWRIVKRHGRRLSAECFTELHKHYLHEKAARLRLWQARLAVLSRITELETLARQRQVIEDELASMPSWALTQARARVRQQLEEVGETERMRLLSGVPAGPSAVSRLALMEAEAQRLDALRFEYLERPRAEVERALVKLEGVLAELRPPSRKLDLLHFRDEAEATYGLPLLLWRDHRRRYDDQAIPMRIVG